MVDYESGVPAWDVGQILTRHATGLRPGLLVCARVASLRASVGQPVETRLVQALATECDCDAGDSAAERTSLEPLRCAVPGWRPGSNGRPR